MTVSSVPRPSLLALRTLVEVAASGSLTKAAESLGVTTSAVSRQLSQLEAAMGAQLLVRSSRPVTLSPIGLRYAEALGPAFEVVDRATSELFVKQSPAKVTLTTYPLFAVKWLLPRLPALQAANLGVDLTLRSTNRVLELKTGEADIAVRLGRGSWPGCTSTMLMSDTVVAVCAPSLLGGRRRTAALFGTLPLIATERSGRQWRSWLTRNQISGVRMTGAVEFDDPLAAVEAAIAGAGVVLTLRSLVTADLRLGRLVEATTGHGDLRLDHFLVVRRDAQDRPAVAKLVEWLVHQAAQGG